VVVAANRKAYSEMMRRVQAELVWRACQPTSNLMIDDSSVGQELVHNRALSFQARVALDRYPTSVAWFTGVFEPGQLPKRQEALDYRAKKVEIDFESMHATYLIWRASLEESFEAIEKILNSAGKLSTINLNHCFLPSIRIANRLKADKVQFVSSYILWRGLKGAFARCVYSPC